MAVSWRQLREMIPPKRRREKGFALQLDLSAPLAMADENLEVAVGPAPALAGSKGP